jgi:hypothetical protein
VKELAKNHIFSIAEGGAKIFEVFRVKNHDFTPKNLIFSNFRGAAPGAPPPPPPPPHFFSLMASKTTVNSTNK